MVQKEKSLYTPFLNAVIILYFIENVYICILFNTGKV